MDLKDILAIERLCMLKLRKSFEHSFEFGKNGSERMQCLSRIVRTLLDLVIDNAVK